MPDLSVENLEGRIKQLEEQVYGDVMQTPDNFMYSGVSSGLQDGEDFDGQSSSVFSNLSDVDTASFLVASAEVTSDLTWPDGTTTSSSPDAGLQDGENFDGQSSSVFSNVAEVASSEVNNDDYHESVVTGSVSGTTGLDLSAANWFRHTLTGNTTFEFNNPSGTPPGNSFTLIVEQDGTGGHSLTWPSSVEWDGGSAPSLSNNAGDKHMLAFLSPDGGTTWIGVVSATGLA